MMNKVFREKLLFYMASTLSSRTFLLNFSVFAFICRCFHSHKTYCDVLLITYAWQNSLLQIDAYAPIECIQWLLLKGIDFNGC